MLAQFLLVDCWLGVLACGTLACTEVSYRVRQIPREGEGSTIVSVTVIGDSDPTPVQFLCMPLHGVDKVTTPRLSDETTVLFLFMPLH